MFFLALCAHAALAQSEKVEKDSPVSAIIIGVLLLIVVIFMLYNKQKRKYND